MKYKELDWIEAAQAIEDGKTVEFFYGTELWINKKKKSVSANVRYRLVEEPYMPEVGERVIATTKDGDEWLAEFRVVDDGLYICKEDDGSYSDFIEVKPIEKAREGWVFIENLMTIAPFSSSKLAVHVREVK